MNAFGWIVGTLILWGLKLITVPFARLIAGDKVRPPSPAAPAPEGEAALPEVGGDKQEGEEPQQASKPPAKPQPEIPAGPYIIADVIVLGIAGLLLGLFTGSFFIGFSWKARDWPGMIAFIGASFVGSALHG